jgi:hypothetical protein
MKEVEADDVGSTLDHSFDDEVVHEEVQFPETRVSVALSWHELNIKAMPPKGCCGR